MTTPNGPDGRPYNWMNFSKTAWCRHKEQYVTTTTISSLVMQMSCSNCGAVATGRDLQETRDALLAIEREATVTEVDAP